MWRAQTADKAETSTEAGSGCSSTRVWTAEDFLGSWMDSRGNIVTVIAAGASRGSGKLLATLHSPPRHDVNLSVRPSADGSGWQCGHSVLDERASDAMHIKWVGGEGQVSVWQRPREASPPSVAGAREAMALEQSKEPAPLQQLGTLRAEVGQCGARGGSLLMRWQPFPRSSGR